MILKLGMQHQGLKLYKDDPGLTLTYFTARSNLGKTVTKSIDRKNLQHRTK